MGQLRALAGFAAALMLAACGRDEAVFVTSTSIGIGADSNPAELAIAYSRYEGFYGPADEKGDLPPVVGRLESNQSVTNPVVRQLYATGDAALDVTLPDRENARRPVFQANAIGAERDVAFFGVSSATGLRIGFNPATGVDSVHFGYKREEMSVLPLQENPATGLAVYPSTIGAIALNARIDGRDETRQGVSQFFATGAAARNIAQRNRALRELFAAEAEEATLEAASEATAERILQEPTLRAQAAEWFAENRTEECDSLQIVVLRTPACRALTAKFDADFALIGEE